MAMPEHLKPTCPPDAHKVIREPENRVQALLGVSLSDEEITREGAAAVLESLKSFGPRPPLWCTDDAWDRLSAIKTAACTPGRVLTSQENSDAARNAAPNPDHDGTPAVVRFDEGSAGKADAGGESQKPDGAALSRGLITFEFADPRYADFLELLARPQLLCVDTTSMFIMRSLSTIYPWDRELAAHFLRQYLKLAPQVSQSDRALLSDFRYGRLDPYENRERSTTAYDFLKLERKLFLQYPSADD